MKSDYEAALARQGWSIKSERHTDAGNVYRRYRITAKRGTLTLTAHGSDRDAALYSLAQLAQRDRT